MNKVRVRKIKLGKELLEYLKKQLAKNIHSLSCKHLNSDKWKIMSYDDGPMLSILKANEYDPIVANSISNDNNNEKMLDRIKEELKLNENDLAVSVRKNICK